MSLGDFFRSKLPAPLRVPPGELECRAIEGFQRITEGLRRQHALPIMEGVAAMASAAQRCDPQEDRDIERILHYGCAFGQWMLGDKGQVDRHLTILENSGLKADDNAIIGHGPVLSVIRRHSPPPISNKNRKELVREMPEPRERR